MTPFDTDKEVNIAPDLSTDPDPLALAHRQLKDATERENRLNAEIARLNAEIGRYHDREERIRGVLAREMNHQDGVALALNPAVMPYRSPYRPVYRTGIRDAYAAPDCTMARSALMEGGDIPARPMMSRKEALDQLMPGLNLIFGKRTDGT